MSYRLANLESLELGRAEIEWLTVPPLPLPRPRKNRWRRLLTHDQHRLRRHFGYVDFERVELGRASIGAASWCYRFGECFGDPNYHMPHDTGHVIWFPARRVKSGSSDGCC
jgi:hypothetical protein